MKDKTKEAIKRMRKAERELLKTLNKTAKDLKNESSK